jgi:hypothetical protein
VTKIHFADVGLFPKTPPAFVVISVADLF